MSVYLTVMLTFLNPQVCGRFIPSGIVHKASTILDKPPTCKLFRASVQTCDCPLTQSSFNSLWGLRDFMLDRNLNFDEFCFTSPFINLHPQRTSWYMFHPGRHVLTSFPYYQAFMGIFPMPCHINL